ncbi:MAG: HlyD family secretion protein [Chitinispirillaceae bacterium]
MRNLIVVWVAIVAVLITMTLTLSREVTVFKGIADAREITVNSEKAVEISRIDVVPGQTVGKGDLLVQLRRPELEMRMTELTHSLEQTKAQAHADAGSIASQIRQLRAERASTLNRYNSEIEELQAVQKLNRELTSELKSIKTGHFKKDESNLTQLRIENLNKDLALSLDAIDLRIRHLRKISDQPVEVQIKAMEEELRILEEEKQKLRIVSPIQGVIGSVNFKEGEKVSPFTPIMTLHTKSPSYIKGFIYENVYNKVGIGQIVKVTSVADRQNRIEGEVVGIGSRIVLFPERLWRRPDVQLWGIEVQIKIPEHNSFLLGEKVTIAPAGQIRRSFFAKLFSLISPSGHASEVSRAEQVVFNDLKYDSDGAPLEGSGVVYLEDLDRYCIISDDTDKDRAILFLADSTGCVRENVLIGGAGRISDMESICTGDSNMLFIAASQSYSKKGNLPDKRKVLLRVSRKGSAFTTTGKVLLYDLLDRWRNAYPEEIAAQFLNHAFESRTADIEGMFFSGRDLCFGFKNPLLDSASVIIRVSSDQLFSGNDLDQKAVSVWKTVHLEFEQDPHHISDLFYKDGVLFITSVDDKEGKNGCVWKYNGSGITLVRSFPSTKPEGVCIDSEDNIALVFDNGKKKLSQIAIMMSESHSLPIRKE